MYIKDLKYGMGSTILCDDSFFTQISILIGKSYDLLKCTVTFSKSQQLCYISISFQ